MALFLTAHPTHLDFLNLVSTSAGRRAKFGDPDNMPDGLRQGVSELHEAFGSHMKKLTALTQDLTRSDVSKHVAAKKLAETAAHQIGIVRSVLATKHDDLLADAGALTDATFAMRPERGAIDALIVQWTREQAGTETGYATIRKTALEDGQLATVLYSAPHFLLGIGETTHTKLRLAVVEKHAPNAFKTFEQANELGDLIPRYDETSKMVHTSFYNPEMAAKSQTRVEV